MKKKLIIIGVIITLIGCVAVMTIAQREATKREDLERELRVALRLQNHVFRLGNYDSFRPFELEFDTEDRSPFQIYVEIAYYKKLTGATLTYDDIVDYFSSEHENDGSMRVYTNGRHSEIEKYVEWWFDVNEIERKEYGFTIAYIHDRYYRDRGIEIEHDYIISNRSVMDELIKKEADPNYVMDDEIMKAVLPID